MYKIFFVFIVSMDQICDAGSIYQLLISVFKSYKIRKSLACGASAITFAFGPSCRTDQRFWSIKSRKLRPPRPPPPPPPPSTKTARAAAVLSLVLTGCVTLWWSWLLLMLLLLVVGPTTADQQRQPSSRAAADAATTTTARNQQQSSQCCARSRIIPFLSSSLTPWLGV